MVGRRQVLAARRRACGFSQEEFAEAVRVDRSTVQRWERGESGPRPWQRPKIAGVLRLSPRELDALLGGDAPAPWATGNDPDPDDETDAWELARRVQATDVGAETLDRLEDAFEELATAYPVTPPGELLRRVRRHAAYTARLLDAKKTLKEHRRLLVVAGWFSLLGATVHIDLKQERAATARLRTAATLAKQAEAPEILAWCFETDAWRVLTDGEYERAVELSRVARRIAPKGSSALIQATAQEGRAHARLGNRKDTYAAIDRVHAMSDRLGDAGRSREHHYQYDPAKSLAYTATTLAWAGDPAAERHAREVIARLGASDDVSTWPRRVASAHIDLALTLLNGGRLDEAGHSVRNALVSGRVVPSNHWRAREVVGAVEARRVPGASDLREAYQAVEGV